MRHGLRRQSLGDLHDYLDVHRRLEQIVRRLHNEIIGGSYRPREPEFVPLEKKLGIARRVVIPSPEDAIVLQAMIDGIEKGVLYAEPTDSAFYSRSHAPPSVYNIDSTFPYPWWELWPEFQRRIWDFAKSNDYVVMTDIANYFDAIPLQTLRNRLVAVTHLKEEVADFLFFLLESMCWRPDYIPSSGVGLPQIQFDAPRLLAHAYLFEVDSFLQRVSHKSFVRWMDDINIGVESIEEGKRILRDLDEMMAAMGLRLNTGKTAILSGEEVVVQLWMDENRRLNALDGVIQNGNLSGRAGSYARGRFKKIWAAERIGSWAKIVRRYFTVFSNLGDAHLEKIVPDVLRDLPAVRDKVFNYYTLLGYSAKRFRQIEQFVSSGHCNDDVSFFRAMSLLVGWAIPTGSPYRKRALRLALSGWDDRRDRHVAFSGMIAVFAKYGSSAAVLKIIQTAQRTWRRSEWAARQVAAVIPILDARERNAVRALLTGYGLRDSLEVLLHLEQLNGIPAFDRQLRSYLLQPAGRYPYPFAKVLIALSLCRGRLDPAQKALLAAHIRAESKDARYLNRAGSAGDCLT